MLTDFCSENKLVIESTLFQQQKRYEHHQMVNSEIRLIIFFASKDEGMQKQRPEAEYGSFHEFIIAQFILKLKKVGETIGQF